MGLEREIRELKAIATLYTKRRRHALAFEILKAALDIELSLYGKQSLPVALTYYQIGEALSDLNRYAEARLYFTKSVTIWQVLNPNDTEAMLGYSNALTKLQEQAQLVEIEVQSQLDENAA